VRSGTSSCSLHTHPRKLAESGGNRIGIFSRQCLGTRRIPDLQALRRESRAWNRRVNRDHIKINWKFDRRAARRKFGYKRNLSNGHRPSPLKTGSDSLADPHPLLLGEAGQEADHHVPERTCTVNPRLSETPPVDPVAFQEFEIFKVARAPSRVNRSSAQNSRRSHFLMLASRNSRRNSIRSGRLPDSWSSYSHWIVQPCN